MGSEEGAGRVGDLRVPGWVEVNVAEDKTAALLDDLRRAVETIAVSGQVERWLDAMATDGLRRWSANNRVLALVQLHERAAVEGRPELLDEVHMMTQLGSTRESCSNLDRIGPTC